MTLRCVLDGLTLFAELRLALPPVVIHDGDEAFVLEAVEAMFYELVEATEGEQRVVEQFYRVLRRSDDFRRRVA